MFTNSFWALMPAIIAIALALITKEVYSSLFVGILIGGMLFSGFSFTGTMQHVFVDGMIAQLSMECWDTDIPGYFGKYGHADESCRWICSLWKMGS